MDRASAMAGGMIAASIPFFCGIAAAVIANLPVSFTLGFLPPQLLALMPLYFWCLVRPDLMPPGAAFTIGLVQDFLSGAPIGVWTGAFIAAYALLDRRRDAFAGLSGPAAVLGFGLAALVVSVAAYFLGAIYFWHLPAAEPILLSLVLSILLYVPAAMVLGAVHRRFVGPLRVQP